MLINGQVFYIDIGFKQQKLAIEIDGRLHETAEDLFESDRWRQNALVADGWRVLRFTWAMLRDYPDIFLARFPTHFTENTSLLCQNRTTEALATA